MRLSLRATIIFISIFWCVNANAQFIPAQGVQLELYAINDNWANTDGGNYRGVGSMGNLHLRAELNTDQLGWWKDGRFMFNGLLIYGRRPSLAVGDYQYSSSIDAYDTFEPYEFFYEHKFKLDSFKIGILDFTSEFAVVSYGLVLINSSFSTPSTITQLPYSFFPYTGLGARYLYHFDSNVYSMFGIYDGKPTGDHKLRALDLDINQEDGAYLIGELGYKSKPESRVEKILAGVWENTRNHTDVNSTYRTNNYGYYLLGEKKLWDEGGDINQGVGAFAQISYSRSDRNFNPWYYGVGFNYTGLIKSRDRDVLTAAYNIASIGKNYRQNHNATEFSERAIELSYRYIYNQFLILTPDIQYIFNPGANKSLDNDLIFYIRSEIKF